MAGVATKTGHFLAKVLGIDLDEYGTLATDEISRTRSVDSSDTFVEEPPTTAEWFRDIVPTRSDVLAYTKSLFPFANWITHYNLTWLVGDAVAGITIGAIVVPQGMAYALLANLEPQYGLYSAFTGPILYWLFATSKDITIGPVAVMSTLVGNVVSEVQLTHPEIPAHVIATALSLIAGCIITAIGLLRCGWIVDLISLTSLSAFMTGSAITIGVGQIPSLMGLHRVNSRDPPYLIFINSWKHIGESTLDAAMGLTALAMLYSIRTGFTAAAKRWPKQQRLLFFLNTLRSVFVILLYTMISWLVNMSRRGNPAFKILGDIPRGFQVTGPPVITTTLVGSVARFLPATVIVLLVEHIAISKSFGRINNYVIDPSQEMVAIGVSNIFGPFIGAYPATGSFSRTAIKSKAGVRTPASGLFTGAVVILATYTLTSVFFYIPSASLSAVIIHAVADLVTTPNMVYRFWRVSPIEVLIFFVGVFVSVFSSIENGIYATVCISAAILLFRMLRARGHFLGKVKIHSVLGDHVIADDHRKVVGTYGTFADTDPAARNVFLPISHADGSNPQIDIQNPYPGVFIYRFTESFNYPNASNTLEHFLAHVFAETRRTTPLNYDRPGERPWNDPGPSRSKRAQTTGDVEREDLPTLKAVILDFSSVNHVDITSVQRLIDVRNQLDRYAAPDAVDWHFACINNRWTRRALASGGFGTRAGAADEEGAAGKRRWRSIFSVAELGGDHSAAQQAEMEANEKEWPTGSAARDEESGGIVLVDGAKEGGAAAKEGAAVAEEVSRARRRKGAVVHGLNRPLFHVDLTSAVQSAVANVEARDEVSTETETETEMEMLGR
ncbi:probable sulfate permease SutB [Cephalotrichum gorgonifer]|uniref:Probable sulfate permease SutB n=1 Tax=Cephalotrichum gorgonifer TaxID=2041049 RepID=A0AAE8MQI9_9PEZI|nr:probable sulfate permease SutB [Cephalotrichum gorgonifer]